jgi:hypothetical protein
MTSRNEFIKYLYTLPEETEIWVLRVFSASWAVEAEEVETEFRPLELPVPFNESPNCDFVDMSKNSFLSDDSALKKRKFLQLGECG